MRVSFRAGGLRYLVRFFNRRGQERFICLLAVPGASVRRAQSIDDLGQPRKCRLSCLFHQPSTITLLDSPERTVGAELGNLAGSFFAHVNRDPDDADECANQDERDQPRWDMTDAER